MTTGTGTNAGRFSFSSTFCMSRMVREYRVVYLGTSTYEKATSNIVKINYENAKTTPYWTTLYAYAPEQMVAKGMNATISAKLQSGATPLTGTSITVWKWSGGKWVAVSNVITRTGTQAGWAVTSFKITTAGSDLYKFTFGGASPYASSESNTVQLFTSFFYNGVHDSTTANRVLFGISTNKIDDHPMVGGRIRFDASLLEPKTQIKNYNWKFVSADKKYTGSLRKQTPTVDLIFSSPQKYTVTLTIDDGNGHYSRPWSTIIDLSLQPGDLIFIRTAKWSTVFSIFRFKYTHVGMYIGNGQMVEAALTKAHGGKNEGVQISELSGYFSKSAGGQETFATVFRVKTSNGVKTQAVNYAKSKVGKWYDINVLYKQDSSLEYPLGNYYQWYCSELMWAAYLHTTSTTPSVKIDLGRTGPNTPIGVAPDWIAKDTAHLEFVGGYWEHYPS